VRAGGRLSIAKRRVGGWRIAVAAVCAAAAVAGCAQNSAQNTEGEAKPRATDARARPVVRASLPLPDAALLRRQPVPDCEFRGAVPAGAGPAEARAIKFDYEQQCYKQSEANVRARLNELQDAVNETIRAARRRD
jgi:hypothetical protein